MTVSIKSATVAPQTYSCHLHFTASAIRMTSPSGRFVEFGLKAAEARCSMEDRNLLDWVMDHGKVDMTYTMELTAEEMRRLQGIRDFLATVAPGSAKPTPKVAVPCCSSHASPNVGINDSGKMASTPPASPSPVVVPIVVPDAEEPKSLPTVQDAETTYVNDKTFNKVTTILSKKEIVADFLANSSDDNWLWYWLAKQAEERRTTPSRKDMIAFLQDSFLFAIGMGLKKPMIRLGYAGTRRYKVYLSKRGSLCFKGGDVHPETHDPVGDEEYLGCLFQGKFLVNRDRRLLPVDEAFLAELSADPVGFMAKSSKDMDRCCYCGKPLEDKRSKDVGYGSTCAAHWGLPWGKTYDEKVPSFAQLWATAGGDEQRNVRTMCETIRRNPKDASLWGILSDALEEAGYPKRLTPPLPTVTIPSA